MWSFLKLSLLSQALAFPHLLGNEEGRKHEEEPKLPLRRALQNAPIGQIKEDIANVVLRNRFLAAKFVRLLFHDCVGGCNGCVDFAQVSYPLIGVLSHEL